MNYCEKYFDLIEDLIENELDEPFAAQVNSHIFACSACRDEYEKLKREKEIYAQYLFEAEQPPDSWANFQARLLAEKQKAPRPAATFAAATAWTINPFVFLRSSQPAFATAGAAVLLFVLGIGCVLFLTAPDKDLDKYSAESESENLQRQSKSATNPTSLTDLKTPSRNEENGDDARSKDAELTVNNKPLKPKNNFAAGQKLSAAAARAALINRKTASSSEKKNPAGEIQTKNEAQPAAGQMKNFAKELAAQIEKAELLLRSFRNVRADESIAGFEVAYEKRQARKLLQQNAKLRRDAENYGIVEAEALLSRVEPYLLEIANLETNPAPDKVSDIRQRVISQNIIASLQVYSRAAAP